MITRFAEAVRLAGTAGRSAARDLYFLRGYFDFPIGSEFASAIHERGYSLYVVTYGRRTFGRVVRSWKGNLACVARNILADPRGPAPGSVFAGHSQGGLVAAGLGGIAKSENLAGIWRDVSQFRLVGVTVDDLKRVQALLREREVRFVSVASPLRGIDPRGPLAPLAHVGRISEANPLRDMRQTSVESFYRAAGLSPDQIMDGNLCSVSQEIGLSHNPSTMAVRAFMRVGARLVFYGIKRAPRTDCVLLEESMRLGIANEEVLREIDHWMIVKTAEGARALLRIIENI